MTKFHDTSRGHVMFLANEWGWSFEQAEAWVEANNAKARAEREAREAAEDVARQARTNELAALADQPIREETAAKVSAHLSKKIMTTAVAAKTRKARVRDLVGDKTFQGLANQQVRVRTISGLSEAQGQAILDVK
jgi:hypothetical protein